MSERRICWGVIGFLLVYLVVMHSTFYKERNAMWGKWGRYWAHEWKHEQLHLDERMTKYLTGARLKSESLLHDFGLVIKQASNDTHTIRAMMHEERDKLARISHQYRSHHAFDPTDMIIRYSHELCPHAEWVPITKNVCALCGVSRPPTESDGDPVP